MVDFGGLVDGGKNLLNKGLDKAEEGFDADKKAVGGAVDKGAHVASGLLDRVGAHQLADQVDDFGDGVASALGAHVDEKQLGQTELFNDLVHGNPKTIRANAQHLADFATAFGKVGQGMRRLDSGSWKGQAAEAFRARFALHPAKWDEASSACHDASGALVHYAGTVEWAQSKAREAIALYAEGQNESRQAVEAYNKRVDAYNGKVRAQQDPGPRPGPFADPGVAKQERAQEALAEARRQRGEAAAAAGAVVRAALASAPAEPPPLSRLGSDYTDFMTGGAIELDHAAVGVVKGTADILNFARSLNPEDPYNLLHPAEYEKSVATTLTGLVSLTSHPERAIKGTVDDFKRDPFEFGGRLLPNAVQPETFAASGARTAAGLALREGVEEGVEGGLRGAARTATDAEPHATGRAAEEKVCREDPVDMATGRMVLPQTDVVLPGALALVLRRTFESAYRAGRWFGPSWAGTLDMRLEIDATGVIFVREDGSLLSYPHPAPGVPTWPTHGGSRWPLDRDGDTYTVSDPGTGRTWHFVLHTDELALPHQLDDRNGNWITFAYDADGTPTGIAHHGGYRLKLTTHDGRITALHLAGAAPDGGDQRILAYGYTDGHLTQVVNSTGRPLRFGYDEHARITSWSDTNGSHFDYVYDDRHRCVAQAGANGHMSSRFTYGEPDPATGLSTTTVTHAAGHDEHFLINDRAQVVGQIDATGAVTRFELDRFNRPLSRTDPLGHTVRTAYDDAGRPVEVVRPDGRRTTVTYDDAGFPIRVTGADGLTVRQTFDERGNRTSVTDAAGVRTAFTYDEAGHLTAVTDGLGHVTRVHCDRAGLPLSLTDPLGAVTRYERDAFGRPVALTDPLGATTRLAWTVEGKLARRTAPDGSEESWTYDGEGNCTSHTDPLGAVSRFEYTDFDLLTARTGPDGVRYAFEHDAELRLTKVVNPQGLEWSYAYDPAGRLIAETDFDGRTLGYAYDAAGRLASRTNGLGETIRYERNELGQTVRKDVEGAVTTFAYDVFDQLALAAGPDATLTLLRDRHGRLRSETLNNRELSYRYDELGRRNGRTTPGGSVSAWTYDPAGNRTELTTSGRRVSFAHDAAGRELTRRFGETITLAHAFDPLGRLTELAVTGADGAAIQRRAYHYRADGALTGVDDQLSGPRRFDLDAAGRVTAVHAANWSERYAYDAAGNQTEASWPAAHPGQEALGARAYVGTRITGAGSVRYEHDAQGRVTLRQKQRLSRKPDTWRYTWDPEDRLTSVITPDGTVWRYRYDPLGRRIAKERMAGEAVVERVSFTWDGTTLCEQTTTSSASPAAVTLTWDHAGLRPIAQTERVSMADAPQDRIDERFFAMVTDLIGTPSELVDEEGATAWRTRTTLWGTTTWPTNAPAYTPLRFPGQYFDPETGLHYNYFRYYDPAGARYVSADPLGLAPAPNPVAYVDNPLGWADPLGLSPCPPAQRVVETGEVVAPKPLKPHQVMEEWERFLGDGPYTDIHPRTGVQDPNRLVSADGTRSIRMGSHEMNSKPTKFHFHMETWTFEAPTNTWFVDNTMVRVPLGLK
ncbi:putative T7SS-secreted protein [Streptomyces hundungensis]|uniref:putative T7SS-secreted protein n=1 Tax=Streptomyces hundungensis TaxID=1077946 RepID=UPI0033E5211E